MKKRIISLLATMFVATGGCEWFVPEIPCPECECSCGDGCDISGVLELGCDLGLWECDE